MPQVPPALRKARAAKLRAAGETQLARHLARQVGKTLTIIVEQDGQSGHGEDFTPVRLAAPAAIGAKLAVAIARADDVRAYAA